MPIARMRHVAGEGNPALADVTGRLWVELVLSVQVPVLAKSAGMGAIDFGAAIEAMASRWGLPQLESISWAQVAQAILATPVVLWAGWPFLDRAWRSFATWQLNMFSLIGLGVAAAYFFSVYAVLFPATLPAA